MKEIDFSATIVGDQVSELTRKTQESVIFYTILKPWKIDFNQSSKHLDLNSY